MEIRDLQQFKNGWQETADEAFSSAEFAVLRALISGLHLFGVAEICSLASKTRECFPHNCPEMAAYTTCIRAKVIVTFNSPRKSRACQHARLIIHIIRTRILFRVLQRPAFAVLTMYVLINIFNIRTNKVLRVPFDAFAFFDSQSQITNQNGFR